MKLVIAQMKHETNTFSPVPTPLARFARGKNTPLVGDEIREAYRNTGSAIGAFIDLADRAGAEIVLPVAGNAAPSGPVDFCMDNDRVIISHLFFYPAGKIHNHML